jgi:hypothetical protein
MHRRCNKRDCQYLHDNTICFYHWKDNSCNYGSKCRKRHLNSEESSKISQMFEPSHEDISLVLLRKTDTPMSSFTSRDIVILPELFCDTAFPNNTEVIVERISDVFKMRSLSVKFNDNVVKETQTAVNPNFEVVVTLGGDGKTILQNKETKMTLSILLLEGWVYCFCKDINTSWERNCEVLFDNNTNINTLVVSGYVEDLEEIPMLVN